MERYLSCVGYLPSRCRVGFHYHIGQNNIKKTSYSKYVGFLVRLAWLILEGDFMCRSNVGVNIFSHMMHNLGGFLFLGQGVGCAQLDQMNFDIKLRADNKHPRTNF